MNIKTLAKNWLITHKHNEVDRNFESDLSDLCDLINQAINYEAHIGDEPEYDSSFGDDKKCLCGHVYYRHFDTYNNMAPIGCKYCHNWGEINGYGNGNCLGFKLAKEHKKNCNCKSCIGM